ncbi:MAG: hypothetical protein D4R82_02160 [Dehalococcoidia bacterium]|nr:MAG: hypothetical protein D4R82_02160 [Dehalococcoidia bacterium]
MPPSRNTILTVANKSSTDILGARNVGLKTALVKTGEFRESDLESPVTPDYIFNSVREVGELLL